MRYTAAVKPPAGYAREDSDPLTTERLMRAGEGATMGQTRCGTGWHGERSRRN
ncbi:hypothetical protein HETIRDRAFT_409588 [Heterobasidion irregulare TC 32-1]|uniref:Uncharacterized protein n=1 Tax=Heterobasidion irregulare (strain TC 32-1) TaxID=747525 RepID=W4K7M6_HETIT|nr:uncharacterized protein HETIRDRAFT_409588 [Heterobasidion irregulare TC 32-1]ETW81822.1 hypothetical protein HETIRDRAFT_409588 [Heterobasidion irregulare TC 32-1]